ncbi:MAG: tRNA (adenosine(37)-N6)-threonylcarbamoyltransferase complex ATPase subunit type 1 TsaE [Limnochordaceae bacterium]|nr:tRNA (adenosine(37)-N6)-threonylcarbamoyltransferase complex ATPase subunit type 1 TsaE [Limnochordaceae bacterium]
MQAWEGSSESAEATRRIGEALGRLARGGDVVALLGPLGAGKTTLVQGVARGLGLGASAVVSPTFLYVREVKGGRLALYHVDAYRLVGRAGPGEAAGFLEELGLSHYLRSGGLTVIEWPEPILDALPADHLRISLDWVEDDPSGERRQVRLEAWGERHEALAAQLAAELGWRPARAGAGGGQAGGRGDQAGERDGL